MFPVAPSRLHGSSCSLSVFVSVYTVYTVVFVIHHCACASVFIMDLNGSQSRGCVNFPLHMAVLWFFISASLLLLFQTPAAMIEYGTKNKLSVCEGLSVTKCTEPAFLRLHRERKNHPPPSTPHLPHTPSYSRQQLLELSRSASIPSPAVLSVIENLGLSLYTVAPRKTRRGSRGGKRKTKKVLVMSTNTHSLPSTDEATKARPICEQILTLSVFNAQSVQSPAMKDKRAAINDFIIDKKVDIMCVTETWLRESGDEPQCKDLSPLGYTTYNFPRPSHAGGIAFILSDPLTSYMSFTSDFPFQHPSFELHQLTLSLPQSLIHIFGLYRPPPSKKNKLKNAMFIEQFPDLLEYMNSLKGHSIIVGDFNFHWDNPSDSYTSKLVDLLESFGLCQYVTTPTQNFGHTLDWVVSSCDDGLLQSVNTSLCLTSDHYSILVQLNVAIPPTPPRYIEKRNLSSIDITAFRNDILTGLQSLPNPSAEQLHQQLRNILNSHAPSTRRKVSNRPSSPWFSAVGPELLEAKRERRRAERQWIKSGLQVHKQIFRIANKAVSNIVQKAKAAFFNAKILACSTSKQLFNVTNTLMGKVKSSPLPVKIPAAEVPQKFCDFFINKIVKIRESLDAQSVSPPNINHSTFSGTKLCSFQRVSENDVSEILKSTVVKTCDLDPLPVSLLSGCLDVLLPSITSLINHSLSSGCFPSVFKAAIVKPLLKKASLDPETLKNYRPVSNLPFFSKLIEKCVLKQLSHHLVSHNLFYPLQSAYRVGHSTETALLKIVNDLLTASDCNKVSLLSLLDLSAAFDTIDHSILLSRLQTTFGISDTALSWFHSYLSDRTLKVSANGFFSKPAILQYGVPQGSVLGPILFVLYTHPVSEIVSHHTLSHHSFSDDNQLFKSAHISQLPSIIDSTQNCISDLKAWMTINKLQLNNDKTEMIFVGPNRLLSSEQIPASISLGDCTIKPSESVRNLGVTLDQTLSFKKYVSSVCRVCYLELRRISSVRHLLSEEATKTLVCAFILSRLDYCNSLLAGCPKTLLSKLQKVQNNAARLIFRCSRSSHVTPLLHSLHWLPVVKRIDYKLSLICFKSFNNVAPEYISDLLDVYAPSRQLRSSSDSHILKVPRIRTTNFGQCSFSYQAPTIWNKLPKTVRNSPSISSFKSSLKTSLFRSYYNDHI